MVPPLQALLSLPLLARPWFPAPPEPALLTPGIEVGFLSINWSSPSIQSMVNYKNRVIFMEFIHLTGVIHHPKPLQKKQLRGDQLNASSHQTGRLFLISAKTAVPSNKMSTTRKRQLIGKCFCFRTKNMIDRYIPIVSTRYSHTKTCLNKHVSTSYLERARWGKPKFTILMAGWLTLLAFPHKTVISYKSVLSPQTWNDHPIYIILHII